MKIFAIREDEILKDLAYLIYYEKEKQFYIELPEDADPWETPLLLSSFAKRGKKTVDAFWSKLWVQQRIIPSDRQNLGQILKENGLTEYDEYSLLMLADGRCAQDDYYLAPLTEQDLPEYIKKRYQMKIENVIPLTANQLLVFFNDGVIKKCVLQPLLEKGQRFLPILKNKMLFDQVKIQTGGYGVTWGENLTLSDETLYMFGEAVPLTFDDFKHFISHCIVNTAEAAELLGCSRQNIDDLVCRNKLHPIKTDPKNKLFLKSEILQRMWT